MGGEKLVIISVYTPQAQGKRGECVGKYECKGVSSNFGESEVDDVGNAWWQ